MTNRERKNAPVATQLLLLDDVDALGRKGEIVKVKPGYARNFLMPKRKAIVADRNALRMQGRLQEERAKQAAVDLEISQAFAGQVHGITLAYHVKVDPDMHMYGSVTTTDIHETLKEAGMDVEKRFIKLHQPIKEIGLHTINLALKEGVTCNFKLKVLPEGMDELPEQKAAVVEEAPVAVQEEGEEVVEEAVIEEAVAEEAPAEEPAAE